MSQLRKQIQSLLCKVDGEGWDRKFVPRQALYELLTRDVVFDAIDKQEAIEWYHKDKFTDWIMRGGRRIFAILVVMKNEESSISYFISHDSFKETPLDEQLPFSVEVLNSINREIASDFYDRQWEFVSPILSKNVIHRILPCEVRMPFIHNRQIGQGAFGKIFEIRLHPDHQPIGLLSPESVSSRHESEHLSSLNLQKGPRNCPKGI